MTQMRATTVATGAGSAVAVHEAGDGPHRVFAIGGLAVRPFAQSPMRLALEDAADKGARATMMDIAGSGDSKAAAHLVMDVWLRDVEEVFERRVGAPAIWTGASIGAWLMLVLHQRHPEWFRSMCALAPALDWDQRYVAPRLVDGTLGVIGDTVVNSDGTALATRELLVSMAPHHLLLAPMRLTAPLHVIFGTADPMAPAEATTQFIQAAHGSPCTGEVLPGEDHGVAKLASALALVRYQRWLQPQLASQDPSCQR